MSGRSAGRRRRLGGVGAAAVVALLVGCEESPVGVEPYAPDPCRLPATPVSPGALEGMERTALRVAVLDAADRLAGSLPASEATAELRSGLRTLAGRLDEPTVDTGCRLVHLARTALERQPETPATLPDRAALRIVVELATAALAGDGS